MRLWHSFVFKFLLLLVAVLLLVVGASGWFFLERQSRLAVANAHAANESALRVVHALVGGTLDAFGQNLGLLATVPALTGFDGVEASRYLKSYSVSGLFVSGERLALYDNAHRLVADNSMVGLNVADSVYNGEVEPLRPAVGAMRWLKNAPVKPFAVTVQNRAQADGVLSADFSFKRVWPKLLDFSIGDAGYVILVDADGTVLFHPQVGKWLVAPTSISKLGIAGFEPRSFQADSLSYVRFSDGSENLLSYHFDNVYDYGLLAVQPRPQIERVGDLLQATLWLLGSLVLVATLISALWLRFHIGRPLRHLMRRMQAVHNGNLDVESGISRKDEIGLFAQEFDLMRISLRSSIRELADHKAQLEETVKARTAALQKANHALKLMSHTDHLTGIPNRRDIMERVHYEMYRSERTHKPFSFLFADIDKFKNFNDTYGHECGDVVLKTVAQVVRTLLRKPDYIARWGGEEFLVVLPETSLDNAELVAERIRAMVAATEFNYNGHIFKVTITLGVALFDSRLGIEHSINLADRALYRGKENGRNRVEVWNPGETSDADIQAAARMREERGEPEFAVAEEMPEPENALGNDGGKAAEEHGEN